MPPTLVNVAVGALLGAALLGAAFDRRAVLVVLAAAAAPDLDAAVSLLVRGATNAALHNVFVPAIAGGLLYWDARRQESWLRGRYGWRGCRVAWVALAAYAVAGVGFDFFTLEAVNPLWPVHDRFYAVFGQFGYSTREGLVQTYVELDGGGLLPLQSPGTTASYHVETWLNPTSGTGNPPGVERRIRIVEQGWQAVLVVAAAAVLAIRFREGE